MAYDGLETLFQNMGPTYSAYTTGEREGTTLGLNQLKAMQDQANVQKAQLEATRYGQMTPYELEKARLANEVTVAELPGKHAKSLQEGYKATKEGATLPSDIETAIGTNRVTQLQNKVKELDSYSNALGAMSANLENVPPAARHASLLQMVQGYGIDPSDPKLAPIMQTLSRVPADQLPQALTKFRQRIVQQGATFQQKVMEEEFATRRSSATNATSIRVAEIAAEFRKQIAASKQKATDLLSQIQSGKLNYEKGALAFEVLASQTDDPVLKQQYTDFAQRFGQEAIKLRSAGAQAGRTDIEAATGGAVPTQKPTTGLGGGPKLGTRENPIKLD